MNINATKKQDISYFSPDEIHPAPDNELLYDSFSPGADEDDYQLYMSIEEHGIEDPLHISADRIILSGHRRHAAAKLLGLEKVPCFVEHGVIFKNLKPDERIKLLAMYNKQREKNCAERLREAMVEIDSEDAYEHLLIDRNKRRRINVDSNIILGSYKGRARITTWKFLHAVQKVIDSERQYWPLTVRRVHYLLLNDPPQRHDEKPELYKNDIGNYKALTNLLLRARLEGHVPQEAIEDETRPVRVIATYQNPADYIKEETEGFLRYYARDLLRGQPNHIEILVEKNAIRKHIELVAEEYCIPCTTARGYSSLTPRYKMAQRFMQSGKKRLVLLILSDFDPDGEEIAKSFPRSLRDDFGLDNVKAHKVALTADDVREHNLPSDMVAKITSSNYKKFVARYGVHVAELDAAPVGLLQEKLRDAIESSLDMDIFRAELAQEKTDCSFVTATKRMIIKTIKNV